MGSFELQGQDFSQQSADLLIQIKAMIEQYHVNKIVFEAPLMNPMRRGPKGKMIPASSKGKRKLIGLCAVIECVAGLYDLPVHEIHPKTIRAKFLGNGQLRSARAKELAYDQCGRLGWDVELEDYDASDAGVLWWCASRVK